LRTSPTMRVLLLADEPALVTTISDLLIRNGYTVEAARDTESGLHAAAERRFDAIVLGAPELHPDLRRQAVRTPIVMLGDKPFDPEALLARLKALPAETFEYDGVTIDFRRAEVRRDGRAVTLAGKELQLLRYLIDNRERIVPREELMRKVWEYASDTASRTIDTHVAWLRQKLEDTTQPPRHIQTIRGKGYRFTAR